MTGFAAAVVKDLRRRSRDPVALIMWLGVPLFVGFLVTGMTGGGAGITPVARMLVVDQDDTFVSSLLIGAFSQGELAELTDVETTTLVEGRAVMDAGEASGLLIIPEGFGTAVLEKKPTELKLITNPAQSILPSILQETLSILADGVFYAQRIFETELDLLSDSLTALNEGDDPQFQSQFVANISVSINDTMQSVSGYLFPPVITLETAAKDGAEQSAVPLALLFFPGLLMFAVFFSAQGLSDDFWKEREDGTLKRIATTAGGLRVYIPAKIAAGMLLIGAVTTLLLIPGFVYHGLPFAKLPPALVWLSLGGVVMLGLLGLLQLSMPSRRAGSLVTNIVMFPLLMAGGSFFPFEAMPEWMAAFGQWTPNGVLVQRLKLYLLDRSDVVELLVWLSGSAVLIAVMFFIVARRVSAMVRG